MDDTPRKPRRQGFSFAKIGLMFVTLAIGLVAGVAWWNTARLEPPRVESPIPSRNNTAPVESASAEIKWPETRLEGMPAKRLLLDYLKQAQARLDAIPSYTALFHKQERIDGKLGKPEAIELKVRHQPFALYLKFRDPEPGKEVVYAAGRYDNHMIAHGAGVSRLLIPRLKVAPDSALALRGNRHPITDAGLSNLNRRLIGFREMDMTDDEAITILDRHADDQGRTWLRSIHDHPNRKSDRPFKYVEVLYDPETLLPHQIASYEWPTPGQGTDPPLAEKYTYENVILNVPLSDIDFDPANPAYAFTRF